MRAENILAQSQALRILRVGGQHLVQTRLRFRELVGCNQSLDFGKRRLQVDLRVGVGHRRWRNRALETSPELGRLTVRRVELKQPVVNDLCLFETVLARQVPSLIEQSGNFLLTLSVAQQSLGLGVRRLRGANLAQQVDCAVVLFLFDQRPGGSQLRVDVGRRP